jgi:spore coat polysaccharide biosynthesis protein SpsF
LHVHEQDHERELVKIVVVIQARTGSTRLPNKVLMPLATQPLLVRMVERVKLASLPSEIVVATTTEPADDPIRELCAEHGYRCHSGDPLDLLDRHYQAATAAGADVAVKIPSDCPLIDPRVIDRVLGYWIDHGDRYDFVSNLHPPTYPDGQDVEVIPMPVLEAAWRNAVRPMEREHTTPWIWERPEIFRIGNVAWETGLDCSMTHRWTIDYREDYEFLAAVYDALHSDGDPGFGVDRVMKYLDEHPEVMAINARWAGVNWYRNHLDELRTVNGSMTSREVPQ